MHPFYRVLDDGALQNKHCRSQSVPYVSAKTRQPAHTRHVPGTWRKFAVHCHLQAFLLLERSLIHSKPLCCWCVAPLRKSSWHCHARNRDSFVASLQGTVALQDGRAPSWLPKSMHRSGHEQRSLEKLGQRCTSGEILQCATANQPCMQQQPAPTAGTSTNGSEMAWLHASLPCWNNPLQ